MVLFVSYRRTLTDMKRRKNTKPGENGPKSQVKKRTEADSGASLSKKLKEKIEVKTSEPGEQ